jgi:hypothetical protein
MFFPLDEFAAILAPDISCVALSGHAARTHAVFLLLAFAAVFTVSPHAQAQRPLSSAETGDIVYISDAQPEGSWLNHFSTVPRVALRDDWYAPQADTVAQSAPSTTTPQNGLPLLSPRADYLAAGQDFPVMPMQPEEDGGIVTEVPDEPPAEPDAPAIPDLAKGILILSNDGDLTFKPGVRIQPRYIYETGNDNNDFLIRRFRLKGGGNLYDLGKYGVELKIDSEGRYAASPSARVENAWLDFIAVEDLAYLRVGLYDIPFSRNALTSDSKLLLMDRSLIKEELTGVGMADNAIGLMLHGRPYGGHMEYAFGIFDSVVFERFGAAGTRETDELMPAGRIVFSPLDPMSSLDGYADYLGSYLGKGHRLEIGLNAAYLGDVIDGIATYDLTAWGVDLFYNISHYTFQTEYDQILEDFAGGGDIHSDGWYVQFGYLFNPCDPCTEFAVRYQELDPLLGDTLRWTSIGFNFYIREHNLKVQTDYTFRSDVDNPVIPGGITLFDEDAFQIQIQLDF